MLLIIFDTNKNQQYGFEKIPDLFCWILIYFIELIIGPNLNTIKIKCLKD